MIYIKCNLCGNKSTDFKSIDGEKGSFVLCHICFNDIRRQE